MDPNNPQVNEQEKSGSNPISTAGNIISGLPNPAKGGFLKASILTQPWFWITLTLVMVVVLTFVIVVSGAAPGAPSQPVTPSPGP